MNRNSLRQVVHSAAAIAALTMSFDASAVIVNGGFEDGLNGWTASSTTLVTAAGSAPTLPALGGPYPGEPAGALWLPTEGGAFAYLRSGAADVYTTLSQSFSAGIGDVLTFDVFFDSGDYSDPGFGNDFNDNAFVQLDFGGGNVVTLWDYTAQELAEFGAADWSPVLYTFSAAGTVTLIAGVASVTDAINPSAMGLDDVQLTAVPLPASLWFLLSGLGLLARFQRRRVAAIAAA